MTLEASKDLLKASKIDYLKWKAHVAHINKIVIVHSSWYPEIISSLVNTAKGQFLEMGVNPQVFECIQVSGSWELPLVIQETVNNSKEKIDMVLALGCVVKGSTPHFDILCQTVAQSLMKVQLELKVPLAFGVLTVNTLEEAQQRANKGSEAAEAAFRSWIAIREATMTRNMKEQK